MSVAISIENVIKRFGKDTIINGLSLDVRPGEFFTLLGPSGCGKTTLLRMIIGFNSIEGGEIKIDGKVINNIPTNKRNMGMVFQNYAIFPHMSVRDNVAFGLKNRKVPQDQIESQVDEILKVVKIDHLKKRMPSKLSGGQRQRLVIADVLATNPDILVFDEPTSALDPEGTHEFYELIHDLNVKYGHTIVVIEHTLEAALPYANRLVLIDHGHILSDADVETTLRYMYDHDIYTSAIPKIFACQMDLEKAGCQFDAPWLSTDAAVKAVQKAVQP